MAGAGGDICVVDDRNPSYSCSSASSKQLTFIQILNFLSLSLFIRKMNNHVGVSLPPPILEMEIRHTLYISNAKQMYGNTVSAVLGGSLISLRLRGPVLLSRLCP